MDKKVEILYRHFQENSEEVLKDNQEYKEAEMECLEAMYDLRKDIPQEKKEQLNDYDDKSIKVQGILLKTYYEKGYEDGSK